MKKIQPIRGTHDLIGNNLFLYKNIEKIISEMADYYDFNQIITPIFESSELFKKPLGEHSDVVLKEMYSFEDRNQSMITLRPEYTTPMIRASISNDLLNQLPVKLYGIGPMFRRERPQKGRYRQFYQINFEIFGTSDLSADSELVILANEFLKKLKINKKIDLHINSLGNVSTLHNYKKNLSTYYNKFKNDLSDESKNKVNVNPLRILDSKNPTDIKINQDAPKIQEFYSNEEKHMFDKFQSLISNAGLSFLIDPNLVRGLDYYCHTVFEFKTNDIGSQNTIIGGGRYDGLVKRVGGPDLPGVGWASGVERIMMILNKIDQQSPIAQLITIDENSKEYGMNLLINLRKLEKKIRYDYKVNIKKSLKQANDLNIKFAIIVGESEVKNNNYTIKNLLDGNQKTVLYEELINIIES